MIKQSEKSTCGQCCLATILNISLDEAVKLVGHRHATNTKELIQHFHTSADHLTKQYLPDYALCRVHFSNKKNTHWIIYNNGNIYDPVLGEYVTYSEWKEITSEVGARVTSSVEIKLV